MLCDKCPLRSHPIFKACLSRADRLIPQIRSIKRFARRQVVLREGELPEGLYCIRSGLLKCSVGDPGGNRKVLEVLGPGELLGMESISPNGCRTAEAATLEASELCFFHRRDLSVLIEGTPGLPMALAAYAVERMARGERERADVSLKSARERLAGVILGLGGKYGRRTPRGISLEIPISRGEIASLAGIALATASRLCKELSNDGVIRTRGRNILILRAEQLKHEHGRNLDQDQESV